MADDSQRRRIALAHGLPETFTEAELFDRIELRILEMRELARENGNLTQKLAAASAEADFRTGEVRMLYSILESAGNQLHALLPSEESTDNDLHKQVREVLSALAKARVGKTTVERRWYDTE